MADELQELVGVRKPRSDDTGAHLARGDRRARSSIATSAKAPKLAVDRQEIAPVL